jgi:hypothetical protein
MTLEAKHGEYNLVIWWFYWKAEYQDIILQEARTRPLGNYTTRAASEHLECTPLTQNLKWNWGHRMQCNAMPVFPFFKKWRVHGDGSVHKQPFENKLPVRPYTESTEMSVYTNNHLKPNCQFAHTRKAHSRLKGILFHHFCVSKSTVTSVDFQVNSIRFEGNQIQSHIYCIFWGNRVHRSTQKYHHKRS